MSTLSEAGVITRFLLPNFSEMAQSDQIALIDFVKTRWHGGLATEEGFKDAMKEVAFIPINGVLTKPSMLMDPANETLAHIFDDDPSAFPPGEFSTQEWLSMLRELGLRDKLDPDTFIDCAQHVEHLRCDPLPADVAAKAARLLRYMITHANDFYE